MGNTNNLNKNWIGTQLKDARKKAGLTQKQLGELVGVQQNHLTMIETGKKNPSLALIERISLATGCTFDWTPPSADETSVRENPYLGSSNAKTIIDLLEESIAPQCGASFDLPPENFPGTNWSPDFWCITSLPIERWAFDIAPCAPELHGTKSVDPHYLFANFITNVVLSNDFIRDTTKYSIVVPNSMLFNMYLKQIPVTIGNVSLVEVDVNGGKIVREVYLCKKTVSVEDFPPSFEGHEHYLST